ncbi:3-alpha,7-alpha,12-alpha-trihydroxy-5-beta-cholest-24-enoyl-CoA hydratase [Nocardioides sp. HDW12B]|uniref:MaoC/PaaZ C-terminal domain-containing protein n=1 Tax=Nocardioides sp. HDW12B TaxID=2714939 RepID=UPI00140A009D|nr:MaoC/PaaZ C-terminal domain-containing protein [Nocardioides sp. HDW12B]QIK66225.1 3-alpha,7-alpha,12-alpha-trihydroxy-5-beta-cholest-24-enoyl-CoA hydratase [Nocardioides sp. HDW12B]
MPIDPTLAVGAELPTRSFSWTSSDVLLYHLAVGLGSREGDHLDPAALTFTTEDGLAGPLQVLPSFGIVAPSFHETAAPSLDMPGVDISLSQVVHGSQSVRLHRPLPSAGSATLTTRISDVWDKGKAAVIVQEGVAVDDSGDPLFTTTSSIFVRGEGGFGGERGPSTSVPVPDREPDLDTSYAVTPHQALLYRLCGDRNPLHADPGFAADAGFPAPILHGLCSYGIVLGTLVTSLLDSDVTRVGAFSARFAGVVLPGESIRTLAWRDPDRDRLLVRAVVASDDAERDGAPVLADSVLDLTD